MKEGSKPFPEMLRHLLSERVKCLFRWVRGWLRLRGSVRDEVDTLYLLLYRLTHDWDHAPELPAVQTQQAFAYQWANLSEGLYLLSDPWFKANVAKILCEEEIQIRADWFQGKDVLDAGCGNGRWAYGFARLGAHVTVVDADPAAVEATRRVLEEFPVATEFHVGPLEDLSRHLPAKRYDLVFCWGVLHHCRGFTKALNEVLGFVEEGGLLYLYLYGRESMDPAEDLELFKQRLRFHLMSPEEKHRFLLKKAGGDQRLIHNLHDLYAPLINRRFEFGDIRDALKGAGFTDITRTIQHTELFIRAVKGDAADLHHRWFLPVKAPPYWFSHH
jgi:SAM-dependent methyltransferase